MIFRAKDIARSTVFLLFFSKKHDPFVIGLNRIGFGAGITVYHDAIYHNSEIFKDKIVLDANSGYEIISMFAARAGAKKVFAVESLEISKISVQLVKDKGLDGIVEVNHLKVGAIVRLPGEYQKVDVIVSEGIASLLVVDSTLRDIILGSEIFKDKIVLDANSGYEIISMFVASEEWFIEGG